ncbi:FAD-binding oxidoreductase [Arhodomonas aquaeolei]|uniref:NAD(P)/FAD-dependent oxidoreductase n=1 Tax=Arhodomonas aquaeolei TaxID=2369 RepID=UPI0021679097|nr:FAD-binding oxidoreductase [Arhodomonas aquaeolei]MCS4503797.1 FAD-binding oxidoreductase [Arhodomonas aquaeolei]
MKSSVLRTGLPNDASGCGWYETLPSPGPAATLRGEQRFDWAIVGAGVAGLAAARRLATLKPDAEIAVIDAQRVGFGTAGRNSGFMIDLPHALTTDSYTGQEADDRRQIKLNRAAIDYMRETVEAHGIECDWSEQGKIHAAVEEDGVKALASFRRGLDALGEPYTPMDDGELASSLGTSFYRDGLHTPGTVLVQPAALMRGLAQTLPGNVTVYESSPVRSISCPPGCVTLEGEGGRLIADRAVLTNNAFAADMKAMRRRLIPVFTYASMTRVLTTEEAATLGGTESWGLIPANPVGTTARRLRSGRIVIRNSFTYNRRLAVSRTAMNRIRRRHRASFRERFPMLPEVDFEYTWGGVLCLSRNAGAVFGEIAPRVFAAICQNGLGLARGTISGKLIAEYAAGQDSDLLAEMLRFPQASRNPPDPLLRVGVEGNIRWREWRAGKEL